MSDCRYLEYSEDFGDWSTTIHNDALSSLKLRKLAEKNPLLTWILLEPTFRTSISNISKLR